MIKKGTHFFLLLFVSILFFTKHTAAQQPNTDSLLAVLKKAPEDTARVNLLLKLASLYRYNSTDSAFILSTQGLALAEKLNFEPGIAEACTIKGSLFADGAKYDEGLSTVLRAITILEKKVSSSKLPPDSLLLAKLGGAYNVAGHNTIARGSLNEGLKYSFLALKARTQAGHKRGISETEYNIGNIYFDLNNYDEALKHYKVSLQLAEEIKRPRNIAFTLNVMGDAYAKKGADSMALEYQKKALKTIEGLNDKLAESEILKTIARLQVEKGDYANAVKNLTTSLLLSNQIQNVETQAYKHALLGGIYVKLKNFTKAAIHLDTALALSKGSGDMSVLKETYLNLFRLDSAKGNYKEAIKNYQLSVIYGDSVVNTESNKKLLQQEMQYKFDYREDSLTQAHLITSTKLAVQKRQNIIYLLSAGLLGLLLFLGYLNYSKLKKINVLSKQTYQKEKNELTLKNEQDILEDRLRISRDLHDEIGATLSGINMYSHMTKNDIEKGDVLSAGNAVNIIQTSSEEMVNKLNDIIWFIKPQNETMEAVEEKLKMYAAEMTAVKNIVLQFSADEEAKNCNFSLEVRKNIYLICKEAVNNAVKYSGASQIQLKFEADNKTFAAYIQDNGKGYNLETVKKGNGLDNMYNRAALINAELIINAAPEKGCLIKLNITR
jgi:signal transduction histidine kinase